MAYTWEGMRQLSLQQATHYFKEEHMIYRLFDDNTESLVEDEDEFKDGELYGVEVKNYDVEFTPDKIQVWFRVLDNRAIDEDEAELLALAKLKEQTGIDLQSGVFGEYWTEVVSVVDIFDDRTPNSEYVYLCNHCDEMYDTDPGACDECDADKGIRKVHKGDMGL